MDVLRVALQPLALLGPAGTRCSFLDVQAAFQEDFVTMRKGLFLLRDGGLLDRHGHGMNKPWYTTTTLAERALALGVGGVTLPGTGGMVDAVLKAVEDAQLSLASLKVKHGGCSAMAITLRIGAGRHGDLEDRIRGLIDSLEKQRGLPQTLFALEQTSEPPAAVRRWRALGSC